MAMSTRQPEQQETLRVETGALRQSPGHPFYEKLNEIFRTHGFDAFVESRCSKYYHEKMGRMSISALYGGSGNDTINGGDNNDGIYGGSGNDTITGGNHNDTIYGGSGTDTINGNDAVDTIVGGLGQDILTGSTNNDNFVFLNIYDSAPGSSDRITDYNNDKINLSAIDANVATSGVNDVFIFGGNNANTVANNVTWTEVGADTIVSADVNGDTTADLQIVLTGTGLGLDAGDFFL